MHFSRLDKLGDPFEGALFTPEAVDSSVKENLKIIFEETTGKKFSDEDFLTRLKYGKYPELYRQVTYVCNFHLNAHESCYMWLKFLNGNYGVALKTTASKLKKCFHCDPTFEEHICQVKYKDKENEKLKRLLEIVYSKWIELIDENEVRVIIFPNDLLQKYDPIPYSNSIGNFDSPYGIKVPVDLDILFDSIVVSPGTPEWIRNCLNEILKNYNVNKKVEQSKMDVISII